VLLERSVPGDTYWDVRFELEEALRQVGALETEFGRTIAPSLQVPEGGYVCAWALHSLIPVLTPKEREIGSPGWRLFRSSSVRSLICLSTSSLCVLTSW
jgi:hypothetical protein